MGLSRKTNHVLTINGTPAIWVACASGSRKWRISRAALRLYLLAFAVMPGQSSVRNGDAGNPSSLNRLQRGLSPQA